MSIVNTVSGGEPIPDYAWIEYQVNTNSWNTTEWHSTQASGSWSETCRGMGSLYGTGGTVYSNYSINSNGNFVLSGAMYIDAEAGTTTNIGGWEYDDPNNDRTHISYVSHIVAGDWYESGKRDKISYTIYYDQKLKIVPVAVPHTSTTVDWNTIVKVHLTEQTGQQFKKYPLVE